MLQKPCVDQATTALQRSKGKADSLQTTAALCPSESRMSHWCDLALPAICTAAVKENGLHLGMSEMTCAGTIMALTRLEPVGEAVVVIHLAGG